MKKTIIEYMDDDCNVTSAMNQWISEEKEMYGNLALMYKCEAILYKDLPWWRKLLWRLGF